MNLLALETSTQLGGAALLINNQVVGERSSVRQKSHSEQMNCFVEDLLGTHGLKLSEIDAYAVGIGPGSFTGIRTALNIAKTFGFCFQRPLMGVDSLQNLALQVVLQAALSPNAQKLNAYPILTIINAYKNMVYLGLFQSDTKGFIKYILGPTVIRVSELSHLIQSPVLAVGDGYGAYSKYFSEELNERLVRVPLLSDYPTGKACALLGLHMWKSNQTEDWNSIRPLYIRESEAEETKKGIRFEPL